MISKQVREMHFFEDSSPSLEQDKTIDDKVITEYIAYRLAVYSLGYENKIILLIFEMIFYWFRYINRNGVMIAKSFENHNKEKVL